MKQIFYFTRRTNIFSEKERHWFEIQRYSETWSLIKNKFWHRTVNSYKITFMRHHITNNSENGIWILDWKESHELEVAPILSPF